MPRKRSVEKFADLEMRQTQFLRSSQNFASFDSRARKLEKSSSPLRQMASLQMGVDNLGNQNSNKRLSMSMLGENKPEINKITAEHTRDILGKFRDNKYATNQDRNAAANLESSPYLDDKLTREIRKRTSGV